MKKQENTPKKKVVTFQVVGEDVPTPNPIYDCEIPIYPVDFPCQHKKPPPWWERELKYAQLQDLLNIWYNELEEDYMLFHNMVKDQAQKGIITIRNHEALIKMAQELTNASILQRSLDCELEILSHYMDYLTTITERFELFYSQPMRENQCKLLAYRLIDKVYLRLKEIECQLHEVHAECNEKLVPFQERGPVGKIMTIINVFIFTLQKLLEKLNEMEKLLDTIVTARTKYVDTATQYAEKTHDFELLSDIEKFKKNAP